MVPYSWPFICSSLSIYVEHLQLCQSLHQELKYEAVSWPQNAQRQENHQGPQHLIQTVHMQLTTDPQGGGTPSVVLSALTVGSTQGFSLLWNGGGLWYLPLRPHFHCFTPLCSAPSPARPLTLSWFVKPSQPISMRQEALKCNPGLYLYFK